MAEQSRIIMDCQSKPIASNKSCLGRTSQERKLIILRYPLFTKTMFGSDLKNLVSRRRLVHNTELLKVFICTLRLLHKKSVNYFFKPTLHKGYNCINLTCTWLLLLLYTWLMDSTNSNTTLANNKIITQQGRWWIVKWTDC